jgi:hypothetical protein
MIRRITIFDFDGTLVNTPLKPENWKGGWWGRKESMLPPHLPNVEEIKEKLPHFVNRKVHQEYIKSLEEPETLTVFMTGRHTGLKWLVLDLLKAFDIFPEASEKQRAFFTRGGNTLDFKINMIEQLLEEFKEVCFIEMWEDREEHAIAFREYDWKPEISLMVHEPPWDEEDSCTTATKFLTS